MNENSAIIISDSDDDSIGSIFDDDDQPASAIARLDQNAEGRIINFEDEDWQRSAPAPPSTKPTENNNGQYRILPASLTNGRHAESSRYTFGSVDRIHPHANPYMAMRPGHSTSSRIDSVVEKHNSSTADANDNNKRVLPSSFSNGNTSKSMHPIVASETRKLPLPLSTKKSPNIGENRMGTNIANGNLQPSSSIMARGTSSTLNTHKVDDDDDVIVYGGSSSHRVLPSTFEATNSNNSEVAKGFETHSRLNPENRVLDYAERAVYQEALQNISREKSEDDLPEGVLAVPLLRHQKMALAWMVSKENSSHCAGGILADDQGLGKTVSTIALIQKQRMEQSKFMFVDSDRLKSEALNLDEDDEGEQTVSNEPKKDQGACSLSTSADQKNSEEPSASNKRKPSANMQNKAKKKKKKLKDSNFDLDSGPIARVRWFRVVLDEAQTIKNFRTVVARACCGLRAKRRWCLSGTPIQNAIDDLFSYFRFLKYDPYCTYNSFCTMIKHPIARDAINGYKKLQAVLKVVLLRRTKETVINGKPIINLPPKTINLNKVDFTQEERSFYLMLEERSRQQFKAFAAAGTLKQNYANILLMLLRLRQACDHPILVKGNQSEYGGDGSIEMAKKLPKEVVIDLLAKLEVGSTLCGLCNDTPEDAIVTICGHVFCYQCIHERITTDENMCPAPNCSRTLGLELLFSSGALKICISGKSSSAVASSSSDNESSSISQSSFVSSKIQAAIDILNSIIVMDPLTESYTMESSRSGLGPVKAIVFSQWTGMLDLLELSLNINCIQYRRLDGTMSLNLREKNVKDFNTDPEVRVMIMSLKAGNLGLNMVSACHVILLDLWWNPYAEDQAVDRAHRIGQTRPVTVSRLTVKDTVEDRILALQEEKRTMVNSAFGDDKAGGHATRLTVEDLRYLFRI
ncbi:Putative SNF2-domain/RING finger domain/helicase domain protein [Zea mays]|uniref:Putative SNF2-domain/RING finger domain/helicase domain protein n=1 Tax=Zea mays TaxID=4577 RepID=A0A1D6PUW5_MAIZE|nr:Putative SNF2-domain/RING finger domain/helicase domain protein [Zea mays]